MNPEVFIRQMSQTADAVRALTERVAPEQARWKPAPESWSILEVVNHLYDEEKEDFRVRLDILLHRPEDPWPAIDPQGWVTARRYNERDLEESLNNFILERRFSIDWLNSLEDPDFSSFIENRFGRISAGDMFAAWVSHDLLHLRQLTELHYAFRKRTLSPYSPDYAGDW